MSLIDFNKAKARIQAARVAELSKKIPKPNHTPPTSITAILESRDGLRKTISIPYPPQPVYKTPLYKQFNLTAKSELPTADKVEVRTYQFEGYKQGLGDAVIAYYREK